MGKKILILAVLMCALPVIDAVSATRNVAPRNSTAAAARIATPTASYNYNYMYPYLNNQMKTDLNPGVTTSNSNSPIGVITRTYQLPNTTQRRVVARSGITTTQNTIAPATAPQQPVERVAAQPSVQTYNTPNSNRRVVARGTARSTSARIDLPQTTSITQRTEMISAARCYADYVECMNDYCERPDTAYNRCYCSSRLAQIDATYKSSINDLIMQLATLQGVQQWSDAEMMEYWNDTISKYTGDNAWESIDNALDIDWSSLESRVRGQNAFATGHEYCIQHLGNCAYAASNLRDAYRSEISRDCTTYEESLQKIKNAAESIIEAYK